MVILVAASLAGCSGTGGPQATVQMPTPVPSPTGDVTENLVVSGRVARQLVEAAAAKVHVPPSEFTGLESSYYAYDFTKRTYWAGAALVPSPKSTRAQMSVQDQGSYFVFRRPKGGPWQTFEVGAAGTRCPITVPAPVAQRWHWPKHACRPGRR
jgi:hypothetical protein